MEVDAPCRSVYASAGVDGYSGWSINGLLACCILLSRGRHEEALVSTVALIESFLVRNGRWPAKIGGVLFRRIYCGVGDEVERDSTRKQGPGSDDSERVHVHGGRRADAANDWPIHSGGKEREPASARTCHPGRPSRRSDAAVQPILRRFGVVSEERSINSINVTVRKTVMRLASNVYDVVDDQAKEAHGGGLTGYEDSRHRSRQAGPALTRPDRPCSSV